MRFAPKTEEQLADENLLPEGNYPFEVIKAEEKESKNGNPMIALNLRLFTKDGGERFVNDWLMAQMGFKLRHFCEATGLLDKYNDGTLADSDCVGRSGYLTLKKEPAKGDFGPKNAVKDYGKPDETETANAKLQEAASATHDSDQPF